MAAWTLITGASKGVGAATARLLAQQKRALVLQYRNSQSEVEQLAAFCRKQGALVEILSADFSSKEQTIRFVETYLQRFSSTAHLIACVGPYAVGATMQTPLEVWHDLFESNFFAAIQLIQSLLPSIKAAQGSIITLGVAGVGDARADTYAGAYFTAKRALWCYTRTLAKEVAGDGVSVNMVSPGRLQGAIDAPYDPKLLPMGREGMAEEVARLIAFLIEPTNHYITGQNIEVAGGVRL